MKAEATKRGIVMVTRVASNADGNGDGGKSKRNGNKGGVQATTRTMVVATTVAGKDERNCNGDEEGEQQRG